jgi:hypothetical protein
MIEVKRTKDGDPLEFAVVVHDANGASRHQVTMGEEWFAARRTKRSSGPFRTTNAVSLGERPESEKPTAEERTPERMVEAAFRFLLDREPKESILSRFDVNVIARYFPEFERELQRYL